MADSEQEVAPAERLWRFATRVYSDAVVAGACLAAQDEQGFDVNLVLFAAWCASEGIPLTTEQLREADARCVAWRRDVIGPLRTVRRCWKDRAPHDAAYGAIKAVELAAERQQLAFLAPLAGAVPQDLQAPAARPLLPGTLLRDNLGALCAACERAPDTLQACELALREAIAAVQSAARNPPDW